MVARSQDNPTKKFAANVALSSPRQPKNRCLGSHIARRATDGETGQARKRPSARQFMRGKHPGD